jgi:branched-chain amino acid transport system substrate-binding protein
MNMRHYKSPWQRAALFVLGFFLTTMTASAQQPKGEPIRIGFGMALTGAFAANAKMALLGMQMWAEDTNAKGGLLGRPVKLVYYDDQSNPSTVPGIYSKLLDVDKVDFVVSGYSTNMTVPAMPLVMQRNRVFLGLAALDGNAEFNYEKYFAMAPFGPNTKAAFSEGFFETVNAQKEKLGLKTIAMVALDVEGTRNALDGAEINVKSTGLKVVYNRTYPPSTVDFTPIVRSIQAANPDVVFFASYPADSVGIVRSLHELGLKAKIVGGCLIGLQATSTKMQLGSQLNGLLIYEYWLPVPSLRVPGVMDFLNRYRERATSAGVDVLGYYLGPWGYADLQVLGDAIAATKSLDQDMVADYIRTHTFKTFIGDIKFGKKGEWDTQRVFWTQFQNVAGNGLDQFVDAKTEVILTPSRYKSGELVAPYSDIKH